MKSQPRRAFTLFELLVILAILAILFAFLLPQFVRSRVEAAQQQKLNNLKQLVLACHNYNDTNGSLPPGNNANNFSATAHLLPYLEQEAVYKLIDFKKPSTDPANAAARKMVIKTFLSPQDPQPAAGDESGATNYLFNAGTKYALDKNDGVFFQDSKSRIPATFQDGTSNTIIIGETLRGDGGTKAMDVKRQHIELDKDALAKLEQNSGVSEFENNKHVAGNRCASWMDGRFLQGTFNSARVPNDPRPDVSCDGLGGLSALRSLNDKIGVAMGDGSARFLATKKLDAEVWKALITPAGGEVIPPGILD